MPNKGNQKKTKTKSKTSKTIMRWLWWSFAIGTVIVLSFFVLVYNGVVGYMPPIEELRNPQDKFATVLYTSDGVELGRYFRNSGNRVYADLDEISPNVVNALIATEDARFMSHSGIDVRALARAIVKTGLLRQRNSGGGSTITQQLAK